MVITHGSRWPDLGLTACHDVSEKQPSAVKALGTGLSVKPSEAAGTVWEPLPRVTAYNYG